MSSELQPTARLLSIRDAGWIEVGDTRFFLFDAAGGFNALREQLLREVGAEFTSDVFYRAGFASTEALMQHCIAHGFVEAGAGGFERALGFLTTGGYGRFSVAEVVYEHGWAVVNVANSMESWISAQKGDHSGFVCDYTRGLLRGVMHHLVAAGGNLADTIECAEISCMARGDRECRFVLGTAAELASHGYRVGQHSHGSVRETLLRLNRQLEEVLDAAQKDPLTGLFNRAYFENALRNRIEYASRRTDSLTIALIDVDHFKEVNDTYGHGTGDVALRQIARQIASQARDTDVVARYGGDEFAWLMPGTSVEAALAVADRIRRTVHDAPQIGDVKLTLSVGVSACPQDATTLTSLIDLADHAMYRAKDEGGNRVKRYRHPTGTAGSASAPSPADPNAVDESVGAGEAAQSSAEAGSGRIERAAPSEPKAQDEVNLDDPLFRHRMRRFHPGAAKRRRRD